MLKIKHIASTLRWHDNLKSVIGLVTNIINVAANAGDKGSAFVFTQHMAMVRIARKDV